MAATDDLLKIAKKLCKELKDEGHECYAVGGFVRDLFMGRDPKDVDLTTDALPEETTRIFEKKGYKVIPTGIQHGTVTVMAGTEPVEVTVYRAEGPYSDGRHPDWVKPVDNVEADLARRDLSINSIALDPITKQTVDPFGGRYDIETKLIKAVGDPDERFKEDFLRMMRVCRFASQLGFRIDSETLMAVQDNARGITSISGERVRDELYKLLGGDDPRSGLECLRQSGLLREAFPELDELVGLPQPLPFHDQDAWGHTVTAVEHTPKDAKLRLAVLLHDVGKPATMELDAKKGRITFHGHADVGASMVKEFAEKYKLSNEERDYLVTLVSNHMFDYDDDEWTDKAVRKFVSKVGEDRVDDLAKLRLADLAGQNQSSAHVEEARDELDLLLNRIDDLAARTGGKATFEVRDLAVKGNDVMAVLGIPPGPDVGKTLNTLYEHVLEDPSRNNREYLLGVLEGMKRG